MRSTGSRAAALLVPLLTLAALIAPTLAAAAPTEIRRGGAPWLFVDRGMIASTGNVEARARAAIATASPLAVGVSLRATKTDRFGDGDTLVRFAQTHLGLPVIGRGATARLSSRGEATLIAIDLERDLPSGVEPKVGAAAAASAASRFSRVGAGAGDAHLVVWPLRGGGARLAWAVVPQVPTGVPSAPRIIVDAVSGKILETRDTVRFAKAQVYRLNPVTTPALTSEDLALPPVGPTLTSAFVRSANCIDNKTVKPVNLFGTKANMHVCDLLQVATADTNGDFVYAPSDVPGSVAARSDAFSEVSMYYHASKAYAFFRGLQGVVDAQVVFDKPLVVVANLQTPPGLVAGNLTLAADPNTPLDPFSNAFFAPAAGGLGDVFRQLYGVSSGALWFGQGPQRDYAYDGDVVYHEFTHAVVDDSLKLEQWHLDARGAVDSPGAMNEGLADYFSSAITGDPNVGEYASADLAPGMSAIRTLANTDKCPSAVIGEVHSDSTLFSGALWQARSSLVDTDRPIFDAALYKAMRSNPGRGDLGYDDLAQLFLATLGTDFPAGAAALQAVMTNRGVLPSCDRVLEYRSTGIRASDPSMGGFAAPGGTSLAITADVMPGLLQVHAPFGNPPPAQVTVTILARRGRSSGATSPFGGTTVPFTPVLLAKFGKPITWSFSAGSQAAHDADAKVDADGLTGRVSATVDVPAGATDIYVQIANKGDDDGVYDDLQVDLVPPVAPRRPVDAGAPAATAAPTTTETGCACSTPGGRRGVGVGGGSAWLLAGFLALVASAARRRDRRARVCAGSASGLPFRP